MIDISRLGMFIISLALRISRGLPLNFIFACSFKLHRNYTKPAKCPSVSCNFPSFLDDTVVAQRFSHHIFQKFNISMCQLSPLQPQSENVIIGDFGVANFFLSTEIVYKWLIEVIVASNDICRFFGQQDRTAVCLE